MKQLIAAALFLTACGTAPRPQTSAQSDLLPPAHIDPATSGSISGRVFFRGDAPPMPPIDMSSNPNCERQHAVPQRAETVIVNPNGTLRNVFISIKAGLPAAQWPTASNSSVLRQKGCVYQPHVLGIMEGQSLEIVNDDPVNHNVHAECAANDAWNESQPPRAEHKFKKFTAQEILFPVTCSVHPWMRSYIGVSPHPFFSVTGEDGSFALKGVPPGNYTIEAVHEKYGKKEGTLTLKPGGSATLEFTYGS